ncbi:MAG: Clp protease ClpS [Verrucomicrobia bacterium]|nr:MAG: Clp protease ClpS [Verrucomicrobiota bacterium]
MAPHARSGTASPLSPRLAGTAPAITPDEVEATETTRAPQGPWRVIVLNDPVNSMSYVVLVFRRVFGFAEPRARRHMLEVHEQGRSVVWSGLREQAELYAFALQQWHLTAILESDETH